MPAISPFVSLDISPQSLDELLCQAVVEGDVEQVRFLVHQGAQIDCPRWRVYDDEEGYEIKRPKPPLIAEAIERGHAAMVEFLIQLGADVHGNDGESFHSPLLRWVHVGAKVPGGIPLSAYRAMGHALLDAGANPDASCSPSRSRDSARRRAQHSKIAPALEVLAAFDADRRALLLENATAEVSVSTSRSRL